MKGWQERVEEMAIASTGVVSFVVSLFCATLTDFFIRTHLFSPAALTLYIWCGPLIFVMTLLSIAHKGWSTVLGFLGLGIFIVQIVLLVSV